MQPAFFRTDVLESYREDPRFEYDQDDFGFNFNISDELYTDEDEPDAEKVHLLHGGFAYDLSDIANGHIDRRVCVFLCDLTSFTPEIQQRWSTFEVPAEDDLRPHPVWWGCQMGHWPDGIGPFFRLFGELKALNELHQHTFGEQRFETVEHPKEFGWLLRQSQREFDRFVHDLDKLLSDNIRHKALTAAGVPRKDAAGKDMGTLQRVGLMLERAGVSEDERKRVMKPLYDIRKARQQPAHDTVSNKTDRSLNLKQIDLLAEVGGSLNVLRHFWQSHPANKDYKLDTDFLDNEKVYRM